MNSPIDAIRSNIGMQSKMLLMTPNSLNPANATMKPRLGTPLNETQQRKSKDAK